MSHHGCAGLSLLLPVATSPTIRQVLEAFPQLPSLLTNIDTLRGAERERAIQTALGVTNAQIQEQANAVNTLNAHGVNELGEDIIALRALAEAVEGAVRGDKTGALGLDWGA